MAPATAAESTSIERVRRVLGWVLLAELATLTLSGGYLMLFYRPTPAQAWSSISAMRAGMVARDIHLWTSDLLVLTAFALALILVVETIIRWTGPWRRRSGLALGPLAFVVAVIAALTGPLLRWDQAALWAVTVGTNVRGFRQVLDSDHTRFVLIGGSEVSVGTLRTWFFIHVLVLPVALFGLLVAVVRRGRHSPAAPSPSHPDLPPPPVEAEPTAGREPADHAGSYV